MQPVGDGLVDEVGDEDDLCGPEVVPRPEEDPGEDEEVVEDEVGCYVGGCGNEGCLFGEEVPDVAELGEEEEDPGIISWFLISFFFPSIRRRVRLPVDTGESNILTERRLMLIRLLPDLLALLDIVRAVEGVVNADNDDQEPGKGNKDPVQIQRMRVVSLTASKGIIRRHDDGWRRSGIRDVGT